MSWHGVRIAITVHPGANSAGGHLALAIECVWTVDWIEYMHTSVMMIIREVSFWYEFFKWKFKSSCIIFWSILFHSICYNFKTRVVILGYLFYIHNLKKSCRKGINYPDNFLETFYLFYFKSFLCCNKNLYWLPN